MEDLCAFYFERFIFEEIALKERFTVKNFDNDRVNVQYQKHFRRTVETFQVKKFKLTPD